MDRHQLTEQLGIDLPADYQTHVYIPQLLGQTLQLGADRLCFWPAAQVVEQTLAQREAGILEGQDLLFGNIEGTDLQLLYRYNDHSGQYLLYDLDNHDEVHFHAFGLSDYFAADLIGALLMDIDDGQYQPEALDAIRHSPDGLHTIAYELYSQPEHQAEALALYEQLAQLGHPESASELADHYESEQALAQSLHWRERAVLLGHYRDQYELADFLLEHYPDQTERALELLQQLLEHRAYSALAAWRLAQYYLQPEEVARDATKGIEYLQQSADQGNYYALADLAFCHYDGKVLPQNTQTAYDLLKQAEQYAIQETGTSNWTTWMDRLAEELAARSA